MDTKLYPAPRNGDGNGLQRVTLKDLSRHPALLSSHLSVRNPLNQHIPLE
jgi:hypothetical protein